MEASKEEMKRRRLALPVIRKVSLGSSTSVGMTPSASSGSSQSGSAASKKAQLKQSALTRHVFDVLEVLKSNLEPFDRSALIRRLAYDVWESSELIELLKSNEKIVYDPIGETFRFKPPHVITSPEDLVRLLRQNASKGVMEVKDLKDSYPVVATVAQDLQKTRQILVIPGKEGAPRYLFPDDPSLYVEMSDEYKALWSGVVLPDRETMLKELSKAGLKSMTVSKEETEATRSGAGSGKRKRVNKRLKITNVHLGLDLRKDLPQE